MRLLSLPLVASYSVTTLHTYYFTRAANERDNLVCRAILTARIVHANGKTLTTRTEEQEKFRPVIFQLPRNLLSASRCSLLFRRLLSRPSSCFSFVDGRGPRLVPVFKVSILRFLPSFLQFRCLNRPVCSRRVN